MIFQFAKVNDKRPRAVYELKDLNSTPIDDQFYREELGPVRKTDRTSYKIDKVLDKRIRRGIREYLVRWRDYSQNFDSRELAASVKDIWDNMTTTSHFTVTLFSNASRDIYEQYTYADFTVKLAQPVDLVSTSSWEVGLCENWCSSHPL